MTKLNNWLISTLKKIKTLFLKKKKSLWDLKEAEDEV